GALYAYGRSLYVTLNQYHPGTDATTTNTSDPNGSSNWTLSFVPEAAKRPDSYVDAASTESTLVLDYELLAKLPPAPVPTASPQPEPALSLPSPNAEKADPAKKDSEIEALRKELQEIKKQLAEQQAERARSQPQKPAP
ncbi:MAG TPA: hypothetical protein VJR03_08125, partial [Nitrospira sp.]|nr:hypothetical protein [Nitrospira sp.]